MSMRVARAPLGAAAAAAPSPVPAPAHARTAASEAPPAAPEPADVQTEEERRRSDPNARSGLASAATAVALIGGAVKSLTLDRGRVIAAFPHARAAGLTKKWALELAWGKITNDVVPVSGGVLSLRGRTLATNSWGKAYATSNTLSMGLTAVGMFYGIPNLVDGIQKDGVEGLVTTRPGRTGALATSGLAVELGLMAAALVMLPKGGRSYSALMQSKWLSNTGVVFGKAALGIPVMFNELGYLDFLNKGDQRGVMQTWGDASTRLGHLVTDAPATLGAKVGIGEGPPDRLADQN